VDHTPGVVRVVDGAAWVGWAGATETDGDRSGVGVGSERRRPCPARRLEDVDGRQRRDRLKRGIPFAAHRT
jgi:hypothetical protein